MSGASVAEWGVQRRLVFAFCLTLALLLTLFVPAVARASDTLDQSQTDTSGGAALIAGPALGAGGTNKAQTFTAGLTGQLDRVDVYVTQFGSPIGPLTVAITSTSAGAPDSTVLASATVPVGSVPVYPSTAPVEVDFASPAEVVSGTQYAIVISTSDPGEQSGYSWAFGFDDYSGGSAWFGTGSPPANWGEFPDAELAFKSYVETASDAAATLVSDSTGVGPGTALFDKATAIQSAVNAGQTATVCAEITNYLGLVKAQTGKKLSSAQASQLTADADNLAALIGCS